MDEFQTFFMPYWVTLLREDCAGEGAETAWPPPAVEGVPAFLEMETIRAVRSVSAGLALVALLLWLWKVRPLFFALALGMQTVLLVGVLVWAVSVFAVDGGVGFAEGMTPALLLWLIDYGAFFVGGILCALFSGVIALASDERRLHGWALSFNAAVSAVLTGGWWALGHAMEHCAW
ncbi:hypothetical protein K1T73_05470 [Roseovarius sp. SCSIO 43702]|uniref:hypothetical protein n=1 Tax=Roseovarius sp. SCSIO 43702 TaxID=2823043 RepID=UPI001C732EC2|nr:hypothetical protein [Roseovarius sp. SCSIO 43702]QYX57838.1 hypothetical protein K1T73_05470 [Roseovarius sp. SCSIO 43702]